MVMNMYMMGEYHLFSILVTVIPFYLFPRFNYLFILVSMLLLAVYYYFTCRSFFKQSAGSTIVKVIAVKLLFMLSFGIIMGIGLIIFLIESGLHIKDLK